MSLRIQFRATGRTGSNPAAEEIYATRGGKVKVDYRNGVRISTCSCILLPLCPIRRSP